ncbi:MAG: S8 family serine peptidase [Candidatus Saganbacteria bacterium]|nr:S8 family serine peptidase [Candidatus Saganbacteria bacterium]
MMAKNKFKIILIIFGLFFGMASLAAAGIFVGSPQSVEFKVPSRDLKINRYFICSAHNPQKIIRFGSFSEQDANTRQVVVNTQNLEPGLYKLHFVTGEANQVEDIFVSPPVYYADKKLSSVLRQALYFSDHQDRESLNYFAKARGLALKEDQVPFVTVELKIDKKQQARVFKEIAELGGTVRSFDRSLFNVVIPLTALNFIVTEEAVLFVRPIANLDLDWEPSTSEGVADLKADLWHLAGYRGKGLKIAVIDRFGGYGQSMVKGDLPLNCIKKDFSATQDEGTGVEDGRHGINCAEIVYDIAPEAQLYLLSVDDSNGSFKKLVDYLIEEKVDIVSQSASHYCGPFDGTSAISQLIKKAKDAGIVWVNSAGNRAQTHWEGYFNPDENNVHRWKDNATRMKIIKPVADFKFRLAWNDWSRDAAGYPDGNMHHQDLKLNFYKNGLLVASADNDQSNSSVDPYEDLEVDFTSSSATYEVEIVANNYDPNYPVYFELFMHTGGCSFEYAMPESSVTIGGDSPGAFTVGAVTVYTHDLKAYSSQGPTNGLNSGPPDDSSRTKPDVCGVTDTQTSADFFTGTSAATPHIAGLAALVKQYLQSKSVVEVTPDEVQGYLETHTQKLLDLPEKNNWTGSGLVVLDDPDVIGGIVAPEPDKPVIYGVDFFGYPSLKLTRYAFMIGKNIKSGAQIEFLGTTTSKGTSLVKDPGTGLIKIGIKYPVVSAEAKPGIEEIKITNYDGGATVYSGYEILPAFYGGLNHNNVLVPSPEAVYPGWKGNLVFQIGKAYDSVFKPGVEVKFNPEVKVDVDKISIPDPKTLVVPVEIPLDYTIMSGLGRIPFLVRNPDGQFSTVQGNPYGQNPVLKIKFLPIPNEITPSVLEPGWEGKVKLFFGYGIPKGALVDFGEGITVDPNSYEYLDSYIFANIKVDTTIQPGFKRVTVYNPDGGVGTLEAGIEVLNTQPIIDYVYPAQVEAGSAKAVEVHGQHFKNGAKVDFGDGTQNGGVYVNPQGESFNCPLTIDDKAVPGSRSVTVTNPNGIIGTAEGIFTVLPKPKIPLSIETFNCDQIMQGNEFPLYVYGSGFTQGCILDCGSGIQVSDTNYINSGNVTALLKISSEAKVGERDVTITNPDGTSYTAVNSFEVLFNPELHIVINSIQPSSVVCGVKGNVVHIYGSGFKTGLVPNFGEGIEVYHIWSTPDYVEVGINVATEAVPGLRNVTITNPDGKTVTRVNGFRLFSPGETSVVPEIVSVKPDIIEFNKMVVITIKAKDAYFSKGRTKVSFDPSLLEINQINVVNQDTIRMMVSTPVFSRLSPAGVLVDLNIETSGRVLTKKGALKIKGETSDSLKSNSLKSKSIIPDFH